MIHLATRVLGSDRWTKISFVIACIAVMIAVATKPAAPRGRVVVTETSIEILHDVSFVGDTISTRALRTLDAVAATLDGNPSITLIEVQASSLVRAQACVDYLIGQGIAPERLVAGLKDGPIAAFLIVTRDEAIDSQP